MADDGFTTVHVTTDPVEGEMLVEALRGEAIEARLVQVNGARLGAGQQLFETRIDVAIESVAQARALLDDLRYPADAEALLEPAEAPEGAEAPAPRRAIKVGVGLVLPTAAHFYIGRPWTAVTLEVGLLYAVAMLRSRPESTFVSNLAFSTIFGVVAADVGGALLTLRALNRGAAVGSRNRQVARGVVLLAFAVAAGAAVATGAAVPAWLRARDLAALIVTCSDRNVTISNRGARDRYVSLDRSSVMARGLPSGGDARDARVDDTSVIRIAAGAQVVRAFVADRDDVDRCQASSGRDPFDCGVHLQLTVQDVEPPDSKPRTVHGLCMPEWSGAHQSSSIARLEEAP